MNMFPKVRSDELIIQELPNELLIYDRVSNKAHCLNQTAAMVWKRCDGGTSVKEISQSLSKELQTPIDERVVWYAIAQFERDQLMEEPTMGTMRSGIDRRQVMRALGVAAMVAVPIVTSIVAPTPAQASSCVASGQGCVTSAQCCSLLCTQPSGTCA